MKLHTTEPTVAFVYDRVNKWGGAERVLLALHEIWPEAPLFTAVYNPKTAPWADDFKVYTSYLQHLPLARSHHEVLPLLTAKAFSAFDLSGFDIVISITSAEAKAVRVPKGTLHICYCLTPTRYLWSMKSFYEEQGVKGSILKLTGPLMRMQDYDAAQNVDKYIAISDYIRHQIKKYYQKEAAVIYPPVELENRVTSPSPKPSSYYLLVSRLVPYKRADIAVEAFSKMKKTLVVAGSGSELKRLQKKSGETIHFTGNLTEEELASYYMHCQALIFPGCEDFGISPVEAQSWGKPVIAFQKGGVLETVQAGKTGVFFIHQTVEDLIQAVKTLETSRFHKADCIQNAQRFSKTTFKKQLKRSVLQYWQEFKTYDRK